MGVTLKDAGRTGIGTALHPCLKGAAGTPH